MFITQYRAHSTTHNRLDTTIYSGRATYGMSKQENVCLHPEKKDHFDNEKKAMLGKRKTFFLLLVSFLLREREIYLRVIVHLCCGMANVLFQLRCDGTNKVKNWCAQHNDTTSISEEKARQTDVHAVC